MTAKEQLLENINSTKTQENSFNSIDEAMNEDSENVLSELIDMVCSVIDRLNEEEENKGKVV